MNGTINRLALATGLPVAAGLVITGAAHGQPTSFTELFASPRTLPAGIRPYDLRAADFNGDGRPDVAVINRGLPDATPQIRGTVSLYLTDASGELVKTRADLSPLQMIEPVSLAVGDLNNDGVSDLVVGDFGANAVISFLANTGIPDVFDADGAVVSPVGTGPASVDLGAVDADTVLNAVTANFNAGQMSFLRGIGDGSFDSPVNSGANGNARFIRLGLLGPFGDLDVMIVSGIAPTTQIRLGSGDGMFEQAVNISTGGDHEQGALGDIDGDGDIDFVVTRNVAGGEIAIVRNDTVFQSNPLFTPLPDLAIGDFPYSVAIADVDGDGDLDLCVTHRNSNTDDITVALNSGGGSFGSPLLKFAFDPGVSPRSIELADLDNDGDLDLLTTRKPDTDSPEATGELVIFENLTINISGADLNGDGAPDVALLVHDRVLIYPQMTTPK